MYFSSHAPALNYTLLSLESPQYSAAPLACFLPWEHRCCLPAAASGRLHNPSAAPPVVTPFAGRQTLFFFYFFFFLFPATEQASHWSIRRPQSISPENDAVQPQMLVCRGSP